MSFSRFKGIVRPFSSLRSLKYPNNDNIHQWIEKSLANGMNEEPKNKEIDDIFTFDHKPSPVKLDPDFSLRPNPERRSLKENDVFNEIFSVLLEQSHKSKLEKDAEKPSKKSSSRGVESPLHAVFEKKTDSDSSINLISQDIRNAPLSVPSFVYNDRQQQTTLVDETNDKETKIVKQYLDPTLRHLDSLSNNIELISFVDSSITRFLENTNKEKEFNLKNVVLDDPTQPIINKSTLPVIINYIIHKLSFEFRSPMDSITIFNKLKKNLLLYAQSCNIGTYNEILMINWLFNKNIYNIEILLTEMKNNGIMGNFNTFNILSIILKDSYLIFSGDYENGFNSIWSYEDSQRVKKVEKFLYELNGRLSRGFR